jgi:hypothetical protein
MERSVAPAVAASANGTSGRNRCSCSCVPCMPLLRGAPYTCSGTMERLVTPAKEVRRRLALTARRSCRNTQLHTTPPCRCSRHQLPNRYTPEMGTTPATRAAQCAQAAQTRAPPRLCPSRKTLPPLCRPEMMDTARGMSWRVYSASERALQRQVRPTDKRAVGAGATVQRAGRGRRRHSAKCKAASRV